MDAAPAREATINQRELLEWFEDVARCRTPATAVQLVTHDAAGRIDAVRSLYEAIAVHPRYGGSAWSPLPSARSIVCDVDEPHSGPPPAAFWFALAGSPHPYAEMGQLVEQLERLKRHVHLDPWVNQAAAGEFRAVLSHASVQGAGDAAAIAFGFLDPKNVDHVTSLASATRVLDEAVTRTRLGRDGGALGLDGPRTRTRALLAAGWLARLAATAPVVLVVDDAHRASAFAVDLVHATLQTGARVLVVLGGEPGPAATAGAGRLGGPLGAMAATSVTPLSLRNDASGRLAAALAGVHPSGLFSRSHARAWALTMGLGDPSPLLDALTNTGWVRPLARDVYAFTGVERLHVAREQVGELHEPSWAAHQSTICAEVASATTEDDELAHVVAVAAAAANAPASSDARWLLARALAVRGQVGTGERLGRAAITTAERVAIAELWRASGWGDPLDPAPAQPASTPGESATHGGAGGGAEAAVVKAASPTTPPEHVAAVLALLTTADASIATRIAAARCLLAAGNLAGAAAVLGPDATQWLSPDALAQLDALSPWQATPGLVARSVEVMTNLHAIAELRRVVPGSAALGHVLLARLELLERYGRLETAVDATSLADEAVAAFAGLHDSPPTDWWRARRARAWTSARHGRAVDAVAELRRLGEEQRGVLAPHDPIVLDTQLWLGRALLLDGRAEEAHAVLHGVRDARRRNLVDEHPELLLARQWHAAAKVEAGSPADAVAELEAVTALRAGSSAVDDEDHLAAQHLLGSALAAAGRWSEAIVVLDHTLTRRSLVDLADAPRVLAARYSRAACLMFLDRRDEAVAELDAVIELAGSTSDPARLVVKARNARGVARLMAGAWAAALFDLDVVVAHHAERVPADDEVLLCARQQRAECLRWLGRDAESAAELDAVLTATATWPPGQPLVDTVRKQRAALTPR